MTSPGYRLARPQPPYLRGSYRPIAAPLNALNAHPAANGTSIRRYAARIAHRCGHCRHLGYHRRSRRSKLCSAGKNFGNSKPCPPRSNWLWTGTLLNIIPRRPRLRRPPPTPEALLDMTTPASRYANTSALRTGTIVITMNAAVNEVTDHTSLLLRGQRRGTILWRGGHAAVPVGAPNDYAGTPSDAVSTTSPPFSFRPIADCK